MDETTNDFPRAKRASTCLSHWQLSRWALNLASDTETATFGAHVEACPHCAARWATELAEHRAAAYAPVPQSLRDALPKRRRRWWVSASSWATAVAVAAVLLLVGPHVLQQFDKPHGTRLKGAEPLRMARLRAGAVDEGAWEQLQPFRVGDQLRIKAPTAATTWQVLWMQQDGKWRTLYAGEVQADEWVPLGLTVNAGAPNAMRLVVCPAAPPSAVTDAQVPEGCTSYDTRF